MLYRKPLAYHTAHGFPDYVRGLNAERVHKRRGIVGQVFGRIPGFGLLRPPCPPVIEYDPLEVLRINRHLRRPALDLASETPDEDDREPLAVNLVINIHTVSQGVWHRLQVPLLHRPLGLEIFG